MKNFLLRAKELHSELVAARRFLHEHAEIGDDLPMAVKFVTEQLLQLGLQPETIAKSGVVATIHGGKPGKTILLRSDLDALPMQEESGLPFASKTEAGHTCGHDLHAAMLLGAARMLVEVKDQLCGRVKLMFQPAEEIFTGARAMIAGGLMNNPAVDAAFGLHVVPQFPVGEIAYHPGASTASCDGFKITIRGKSCHGAQPQNGIDPINAAAHLVIALQSLLARETAPDQTAALTVGSIHAGSAPNIIPDIAVLQGTMRTYDRTLRAHLRNRLHEMAEHTATSFGATATIETLSDVPSIITNPEMLEEAIGYINSLDDHFSYNGNNLVTASDDFALVTEKVPSVFVSIGAAPEDASKIFPPHNAKVVFNEECLPIGAAMHAQVAFNWLQKRGG